ncbi:hypothetical protein [Lapillicoccus jejuensis]|uniref:4-amino-4-deoxy-L-arabinose transferase-like glycosyltransferase n=1 Tax=Lapillicoccus jejuensis TaxID=402171 RepID=A0A542E2K3_9MICO|nr:hypothetical protein [Lapillicoccus jejuensis]TQJ09572.1 hypothetical protein FB458_2684 [Lapillicoccus jejuensis]
MDAVTAGDLVRAPGGTGTTAARGVRTSARVAVVLAAAAGIPVVGLAYRLSGSGACAQLYYAVFWAGLLLAALPVTVLVVRAGTHRRDRVLGLALLALVTAAPKYLRNPAGPLYHDEYAHWREALDVLAGGALRPPNAIIPIAADYPGTSALTALVHALSGLDVWGSGLLLVLSAHVLAFFAVLVLGQVHLGSARAGAVSAVVYSLNSSVLYFDTQYAYESVTMPWFLWVLALTSLAAREPRPGARRGLVAGAVLVAAATVVTHHLTTLSLAGVLLLVTLGQAVRPRLLGRTRPRGAGAPGPGDDVVVPAPAAHPRVWPVVTAAVLGLAGLWVGLAARATLGYLSPYAGSSVTQLGDIASGDGRTGRRLLAASSQPLWERGLSGLAPLLVGLVCLWAVLLVRRTRTRWSGDTLALMVFGLVYFPSVAFILAPMGAEGARRSWAFTYAGVALLVALAVAHPPRAPGPLRRVPARWWPRLGVLALAAVMVGNVGAGLNDPYRFPGPFTWGSDTNSASAEARTVAEQLGIAVGPDGPVRAVADRYTGLALSAYGGVYVATPSTGFPAADLAQTDRDPEPDLVRQLVESRYDYLVVDTRMADAPAFNGDNYGDADPLSGRATPRAFLERLDTVPWASRVMSTDHLRVYRLDLSRVGRTLGTVP